MTNNINLIPTFDTIAAILATDLLCTPDADFLATLDAHDDASHFAELDIIDMRDEPSMIADAFAPTSPDHFDFLCDMILDIMRDRYTDLHTHLTSIITNRAADLRP